MIFHTVSISGSEEVMFTNSTVNQHSVIYLVSWPPLTLFPTEDTPHVSRICAMLARRPSTLMFVGHRLDIPLKSVCCLLDKLHLQGHIATCKRVSTDNSEVVLTEPEPLFAEEVPTAAASFLSKFWRRLLTK